LRRCIISFEGYYQKLCKNGHYWTTDCYINDEICPYCGEISIWENLVNITNGSFYTDPETGKEKRIDGYIELKIKSQKKCDKCDSILETIYEIPKIGG